MDGRFPRRRPVMLGMVPPSSSPPPPSPSASFLGTDTTTQGAWKGTYGATGYFLAENSSGVSSLPSWCSGASISGESFFNYGTFPIGAVWDPDKGDTSGTFASVWFSSTSETIQITQNAFTSFHLEMYLVDADTNQQRVASVTITDLAANVLDGPRSFGPGLNGTWLKYAISGGVNVIITQVAGANCETPGVLFDA